MIEFGDERLPKAFWNKVDTISKNGCWIFSRDSLSPYPMYKRQGRAHRVAYQALVGTTDLVIDHLCGRTKCVNPEHLEAVTSATNVLRGANSWWVDERNVGMPICRQRRSNKGSNSWM